MSTRPLERRGPVRASARMSSSVRSRRFGPPDPVEFKGEYVHIAESIIGLKPVQKPHPPIYMAAYTPGALQRVARESNGWFPVGIPLKAVPEMFGGIQAMAKEAGRDPSKLELIVRGNCELSDTPISGERAEFTGTIEQVGADIATASGDWSSRATARRAVHARRGNQRRLPHPDEAALGRRKRVKLRGSVSTEELGKPLRLPWLLRDLDIGCLRPTEEPGQSLWAYVSVRRAIGLVGQRLLE